MSKLSNHKKLFFIVFLVLIIAGGFFVWGTRAAKALEGAVPVTVEQLPPGQQAAATAIQGPGIGQTLKDIALLPITLPAKAILLVVNFVLNLILFLLTKLIYLAGYLVDAVLNIKQFSRAAIVTTGWQITRDLCNMFFALILLIMAFATILQIETWGLKKILWRLVVAALLINFSLVFAGVIIDFSQVFTNYFLDAAKGGSSFSAQLMNGFGVANLFNVDQSASYWQKISETWSGGGAFAIEQVFGIIILLICAFSLFAFAFFLIVRIVMLWLLLIFAPLAWVSMIVPGKAHSLWEQWWSNFFKWVFFAPIYMFFLYLGLTMVKQNVIQNQLAAQAVSSELKANFMSSFFSSPKAILQYIVLIIIMLGGLLAAQKFGIYGANGVMKLGKTMAGAAPAAAKFLGGVAERWAAKGAEKEGGRALGWNAFRRATSYLSPKVWQDAWKARQAQKEREAYPVAVGARQDLFNRLITWRYVKGELGEKTDYRERAARTRRADERKDIKTINAEEQINLFESAKRLNNVNKASATLQAMTEQNDQNELLKYYCRNWKALGLNTKFNREEAGYDMTAEGWTSFVEEQMKPMMGEQAAYRLGLDMVRVMEGNGQWIGRPFNADSKTGQYYIVGKEGKPITKSWKDMDPGERKVAADASRYAAHVEWSKQDPQKQINTTGRFTYVVEKYDPDGNTVVTELTEAGKEKIAVLEPGQFNRMHTHSRATLFYRFGNDVKKLNAGLYGEFEKRIKEGTAEIYQNEAELEKYITNATSHIPKLNVDEMKNAKTMIREINEAPPKTGKKGVRRQAGGGGTTGGPTPSTEAEVGEPPGTD